MNTLAAHSKDSQASYHCYYLGLGSNQSNPIEEVEKAITALKASPSIQLVSVSPLYRSKAFGYEAQNDFINAVVKLNTSLSPLCLLHLCQTIEQKQGHQLKKRWGPRQIDIDILLYEDRTLNFEQLTIPHPGMKERDFVLQPLYDIEPSLVLPSNVPLESLLNSKHNLIRVASATQSD